MSERVGDAGYLVTPKRRRTEAGSHIHTVRLGPEKYLAYDATILTAAITRSSDQLEREQFIREYSVGNPTATVIGGEQAVVVVSPILLGGRRNPFNVNA